VRFALHLVDAYVAEVYAGVGVVSAVVVVVAVVTPALVLSHYIHSHDAKYTNENCEFL